MDLVWRTGLREQVKETGMEKPTEKGARYEGPGKQGGPIVCTILLCIGSLLPSPPHSEPGGKL